MKLRTILAGTVLAALAAPVAAWSQTPPIEDGTVVGGSVPSFLELILMQPTTAFASFSKAKTYQLSFDAQVTATDAPTLLTLADGEVTSGSKLGRLASGSKLLPLPLEASVGSATFQSLQQPVDPLLKRWTQAGTRQPAKVKLRQKVKKKASGNYRKVILVTLSTETP